MRGKEWKSAWRVQGKIGLCIGDQDISDFVAFREIGELEKEGGLLQVTLLILEKRRHGSAQKRDQGGSRSEVLLDNTKEEERVNRKEIKRLFSSLGSLSRKHFLKESGGSWPLSQREGAYLCVIQTGRYDL